VPGAERVIDTKEYIEAMASHAMTTGYFDHANQHEPKSNPGMGLHCAIWVQSLQPATGWSGLNSTSTVLVVAVRIYSNMLQEPQDAIDPNMMEAVDTLLAAYSGDFTLGGLVSYVDLLGQFGTALGGEAGYVQIGGGEGSMHRVFTIMVPLVLDNSYSQVA
jgi:hypothetical protein